jgi:hypothetical protein
VLPVAALQVDSCILDDQPDHLVPKEVVRNNIHLLMGLAEKSLRHDQPPPTAENPPLTTAGFFGNSHNLFYRAWFMLR